MFYCFSCDRPRDSNEEDNADYSGEEPVCSDCVYEREQQNWWTQQDQDDEWILNNSQ